MKIIDSGNYIPTTYRFRCAVCNCVYEADEWELQYSDELAFPRYRYTRCPLCGKEIPTDYAEIVNSMDTLTETISEKESKSESTENHCEKCGYSGTRDDSSKFCMIPGKELSDTACDRYKSIETYKAERTERTTLGKAVNFIQTYCTNNHNCKDCPFDRGEGCELVQEPRFWNTDL